MDQHSVQVYSSAKPRIVTCEFTIFFEAMFAAYTFAGTENICSVLSLARELQSKEYFIWNSTGTAPVSSGQMML